MKAGRPATNAKRILDKARLLLSMGKPVTVGILANETRNKPDTVRAAIRRESDRGGINIKHFKQGKSGRAIKLVSCKSI